MRPEQKERMGVEAARAYWRDYRARRKAADPEWWAEQTAIKRKWAADTGYDKTRDRMKIRARRAVQQAVAQGTLVRQPCEVCGEPDAHAHHDDYEKRWEIRWLCPAHHGEEHRL